MFSLDLYVIVIGCDCNRLFNELFLKAWLLNLSTVWCQSILPTNKYTPFELSSLE